MEHCLCLMPGKKDEFKPGKKDIEKFGAEFLSISIDTLIVINPSNAHHNSNYDTIFFFLFYIGSNCLFGI